MKAILYIGFVAAIMATTSATLNAQLSTASVRGAIHDISGAAIPGATVLLRNLQTGVETRTSSTNVGDYLFLDVQPGHYNLEASKEGFATQKTDEFVLQVNQFTTLDFVLPVGSTRQVIEVQAQAQALQTASAETGNVVQSSEVADLPLNGRAFTNLLITSPGVARVDSAQTYTITTVGTYFKPAVNGAMNRSNLYVLDGTLDIETFGDDYAVPPGIDTIQEMKIQGHNDSAEFGGSIGATINIVTKSGTNIYHGTAWEFVQNNDLNSRNTFNPTVPAYQQNQFGATIGGPLRIPKLYNGKDKTFLFFGFEGFRKNVPGASYYELPTAQELQGDFTDTNLNPYPIYDPSTTTLNASGQYVKTQFPGNLIPQNRLNAGNVYYTEHIGLPLGAPTNIIPGDNYFTITALHQTQDTYNGRIDENLGSRDSLFFRYNTVNYFQYGGPAWNYTTNQLSGPVWSVSWSHVFSPTSILQIQGGRVKTIYGPTAYDPLIPSNFLSNVNFLQAMITGYPMPSKPSYWNVPINEVVPTQSTTGWTVGATMEYEPQTTANGYSMRANYTKVLGRHELKMGGELNKVGEEFYIDTYSNSYGVAETQQLSNPTGTGDALASYLLGLPESLSKRNVHETMRWGGVAGAYFQDKWRFNDKLTLNLGVRWDHTYLPPFGTAAAGNEYVGNMDMWNGTYDVQKLPPQTCAVAGSAPCIPDPTGALPANTYVLKSAKFWDLGYLEFQPRFGIAYKLFKNTALRGAYGIVFDNYAGIVQTGREDAGTWPSNGITTEQSINAPTPTNLYPDYTPQNLPNLTSLPAATPFTQSSYFDDPALTAPYSEQYNFGVQQQVSPSTVLTVNFVGQSQHRLNTGGTWNTALTPGPGTPHSRAPFPNISIEYWAYMGGAGNYNALQVQLNRRVAKGLTATFDYTWSKTIDEGCSGWFGSEGCQNETIYDNKNDRGVSTYNLPNILNMDWAYHLPIGTGERFSTKNKVLDYIVGNWQYNALNVLESGQNYSVLVAGDIANIGLTATYERANFVSGVSPKLPNRNRSEWYNPAAYQAPPRSLTARRAATPSKGRSFSRSIILYSG